MVLLRKSIPQNHNLKSAAELGVKEKKVFYINMGIAAFIFFVPPVSSMFSTILKSFVYFLKPKIITVQFIEILLTILIMAGLFLLSRYISKSQNYISRLPQKNPGEGFLIFGLVLLLIYKISLVLAYTTGSGLVMVVQMVGFFVIILSLALIGFGLYKTYKALTPANP